MTDLLTAQAEIKSRFHPEQKRDAGKFVDAVTADQLHVAKLARKQALKAELIARGLLPLPASPGCTMVKQHQRRIHEDGQQEASLFDAVAA